MSKKKPELRFESIADMDVDGAALEVGIQHYPIGPARPMIRVNTGALELSFNVHHGDISDMIAALKIVQKHLQKMGLPA